MRTPLIRACLVCLAIAVGASSSRAQPQPFLEMRVQSVSELAAHAEYLGDLVNQAELAKNIAQLVKAASTDAAGLEGLDPSRPVGLYGFLTENVVDSPVVVLVPIKDPKRFINALANWLRLDPKKAPDGSWQVRVEPLPEPVQIRFIDDYAYLLVRYGESQAAAPRLDPKEFFKTPLKSVMQATLRLDQIPESVLKPIIANAELKVGDYKVAVEDQAPAEQHLQAWVLEQGLEIAVQVLKESKSLELIFNIQPKTDQLKLDLELVPKPGSLLQKQLQALGQRPGLGGIWTGTTQQRNLQAINFALGTTQKKGLPGVVQRFAAELVDQVPMRDRKAVRTLVEAIQPTLEAADMDLFYRIMPRAVKSKHIPLVAGLKVVQGRKIEEAVKKIDVLIPENVAKLSFDMKKVGNFSLHKVDLLEEAGPARQLFGPVVWLAISDQHLLLSNEVEPTHLTSTINDLKVGLKPTPVMLTRGSYLASMEIYDGSSELAEVAQVLEKFKRQVFGESTTGKDELNLTLSASDTLKLNWTMNGKLIKFFVTMASGISE